MPEDKRFLNGESIGELMDRVHPALARLRAEDNWDTVLLVLHGGVNRAILSHALTGQRLFLGNLAQTAGCINALDVGDRCSRLGGALRQPCAARGAAGRHPQHDHGNPVRAVPQVSPQVGRRAGFQAGDL